jgi:hypothetical protein
MSEKRTTERTQVKGQKPKVKAQNGADSEKRTADCRDGLNGAPAGV